MISRHRLRSVVAPVALIATAASAGCSSPAGAQLGTPPLSSGTTPSEGSPAPTATASTGPVGPPEPLTGVPGSAIGAVVAVPIDVAAGRPAPVGLGDADMVSVEFSEAGLIRLVGLFQSRSAARVGPAAMFRPSDLKFVGQTAPVIAQFGAPAGFLADAQISHIAVRSAFSGAPGFSFTGSTPYVNTAALRAAAKGAPAPLSMFSYASTGGAVSRSGVTGVHRISIAVSGHPTIVWTFNTSSHLWQSTIGGAAVTTANLVVLTTPYLTKRVPVLKRNLTYANPVGTGKGILAASDSEIAVTWDKRDPLLAMNFLGPDQNTPQLTPGNTWIFLTPAGAAVTAS
jgi:hypothetical protein